jgi:hypothetical protein
MSGKKSATRAVRRDGFDDDDAPKQVISREPFLRLWLPKRVVFKERLNDSIWLSSFPARCPRRASSVTMHCRQQNDAGAE